MRLAIVVPDARRIAGNRLAFSLASALAVEHAVVVVSQEVGADLVEPIQRLIAPAQLAYVHLSHAAAPSGLGFFLRQWRRGPDRSIDRLLADRHRLEPFDAVVVIANEGRWLGQYLGQWTADRRPLRCLCLLELMDHPFLMAYGRRHPVVRTALYPAYAVLHAVERGRLAAFDRLACISGWSARLAEYLYGLPAPVPIIAAVDLDRFRPNPAPSTGAPFRSRPGTCISTMRA